MLAHCWHTHALAAAVTADYRLTAKHWMPSDIFYATNALAYECVIVLLQVALMCLRTSVFEHVSNF